MLSAELGPDGGFLVEAEEEIGAPGGRIVLLYADHDTQNALTAWAEAAGFDVGGDNPHEGLAFHVTLLATANDVAIPLTDQMIEPVTATARYFEAMGQDADTPALMLETDDQMLADLRGFYVHAYGAEPTFDFRPHVSLSYAWSGEPALEDLEPPDFPLVFDRLVVDLFDNTKETKMPRDRKGLMDWLDLGGSEDEESQAQREALTSLILSSVREVDDIAGMVAEAVSEGDLARLAGLRGAMMTAMDELIRLETEWQRLTGDKSASFDAQKLRMALAALGRAA